MARAFRTSGGIVSSEEITAMLLRRTDQPLSVLARWIVDHDVLSFKWHSRMMLPLFQFHLDTVTVRQKVTKVIRELVPAMSDWAAALWFAQPNPWLADAAPVDVIESNFFAVYAAARVERFLAL
jgi:Protein of unknown function (DUF2384)